MDNHFDIFHLKWFWWIIGIQEMNMARCVFVFVIVHLFSKWFLQNIFFGGGGVFITLDYRIVYAKVRHTIWLFVSTVIYYGFVTVWHALTRGILRLASVLSWCMICPQRLQLLTVLGYLLFFVAVNPQLHLFEICLLIDKDIENDSIFGENVLQGLEDRARSLKAFRYIVYWMWQLLQGLCIIQSKAEIVWNREYSKLIDPLQFFYCPNCMRV